MKCCYWPKYVPGVAIQQHMEDKSFGAVEVLNGILNGQEVKIFAMKEPNYVMMCMPSYGTLEEV